MAFTKLGYLAIRLTQRDPLLQRLTVHKSRALLTLINGKSTLAANEEVDEANQPLVYSTSKAATWDPAASRMGESQVPWFQPIWVLGSIAAILIYFCVLREENDIDQRLSMDLTDHFQGEARDKLAASQRIPLQYAQQRNYERSKKDIL